MNEWVPIDDEDEIGEEAGRERGFRSQLRIPNFKEAGGGGGGGGKDRRLATTSGGGLLLDETETGTGREDGIISIFLKKKTKIPFPSFNLLSLFSSFFQIRSVLPHSLSHRDTVARTPTVFMLLLVIYHFRFLRPRPRILSLQF